MSSVASPTRARRQGGGQQPRPAPAAPWWLLLLLGFSFAFGYGSTDRLLRLKFGGWVPLSQPFGVRPTPGRSLEQWRQGSGEAAADIRGDLELLELQNLGRREAEQLRRDQAERERQEAADAALRLQQQRIPAPGSPSDVPELAPPGGASPARPEATAEPVAPPPPAERP